MNVIDTYVYSKMCCVQAFTVADIPVPLISNRSSCHGTVSFSRRMRQMFKSVPVFLSAMLREIIKLCCHG